MHAKNYKLFGRTFGVQSLRCCDHLVLRVISAMRKADAGGAAVALVDSENRIVPYCLFFKRKNLWGAQLFLQSAGQLFIALHGQRIGSCTQRQLFHFMLPFEFDKLINDVAHFGPVAFDTLGNL